jgi:Mitochondrial carrier protein
MEYMQQNGGVSTGHRESSAANPKRAWLGERPHDENRRLAHVQRPSGLFVVNHTHGRLSCAVQWCVACLCVCPFRGRRACAKPANANIARFYSGSVSVRVSPGMAIPLAGTVIDFAMMFWVYGRALALISGQNNTAPAPAPPISHVRPPVMGISRFCTPTSQPNDADHGTGCSSWCILWACWLRVVHPDRPCQESLAAATARAWLHWLVSRPVGCHRTIREARWLACAVPWALGNAGHGGSFPPKLKLVVFPGLPLTSRHSLAQIPGMCAWFTTYEWCKRTLSESTLPGFASRSSEPTGATTVVAGAAAGVAYWSAFYPADTVRSEVQTRVHAGASPSFLQVFREVYQGSGVRGLYRGLSTAVIRAIPGNAVCFSVYELVAGTLHDRFDYLM